MNKVAKALRAFRIVMVVVVIGLSVLLMQDSVQEESVNFVPSPGQVTADSFPCPPADPGTLPSSVIVLPTGETDPVKSTELVGPALEQVFNNGPSIGVVMDFCK